MGTQNPSRTEVNGPGMSMRWNRGKEEQSPFHESMRGTMATYQVGVAKHSFVRSQGSFLSTQPHSPTAASRAALYHTIHQVQMLEGTNRGGENNSIFSRHSCGGSNYNGDFIRRFAEGVGRPAIDSARNMYQSMERNGADEWTRTRNIAAVNISPRRFRQSMLPTLPPAAFRPVSPSSSFMSVSGRATPMLPHVPGSPGHYAPR
eukprot:SAG11_NODE_4186_length_2023_cov_3.093035_2_plen_204_part_00